MAVLFIITSALQRLRHDEDEAKRLDPRPPLPHVFALRNLENYSEGLLRAVLLRAVMPAEWGSSSQSKLKGKLEEYANAEGQDIILGELLLAMVKWSVDRSLFDTVRPLYAKYLGVDCCEQFKQALLV